MRSGTYLKSDAAAGICHLGAYSKMRDVNGRMTDPMGWLACGSHCWTTNNLVV